MSGWGHWHHILKGISSGDFEEALIALLGKDAGALSASITGRFIWPKILSACILYELLAADDLRRNQDCTGIVQ